MTPGVGVGVGVGVGERRWWRLRRRTDRTDEGVRRRVRYAREAREIEAGRPRHPPTSHSKAKAKRADGDTQTTVKWSDIPLSQWTQGTWQPAASPPSCALNTTNGAMSTISAGSKLTYQFYGTSIAVNIVKFSSGAPYIVTLDDTPTRLDSFSAIDACTADFIQVGLQKKQHSIVIQHDGSSQLAASGKSTLLFRSFVYTPFVPNDSSNPAIPAIVGGVLGAVAFFIVAGFVYWLWRRRKLAGDKATVPSTDAPHHQDLNSTQRGSNAGNSYITPYITPSYNNGHSYGRKRTPDDGRPKPRASTDSGHLGSNLSSNSRGVSTSGGLGVAGLGSGSGSGLGSGSSPGDPSGSGRRAAKPRATAPSPTHNPPTTSRTRRQQSPPSQANLLVPAARRSPNWVSAEDDLPRDVRTSSYSLSEFSHAGGQPPLSPPPPSYEAISRSLPLPSSLPEATAMETPAASSSRQLPPPPLDAASDDQGRLSAADVDTIARRVVQLMQTPHGAHTPPQVGQYHPDVRRAVEGMLAHEEKKG